MDLQHFSPRIWSVEEIGGGLVWRSLDGRRTRRSRIRGLSRVRYCILGLRDFRIVINLHGHVKLLSLAIGCFRSLLPLLS